MSQVITKDGGENNKMKTASGATQLELASAKPQPFSSDVKANSTTDTKTTLTVVSE